MIGLQPGEVHAGDGGFSNVKEVEYSMGNAVLLAKPTEMNKCSEIRRDWVRMIC
jgi:hypothetical protein